MKKSQGSSHDYEVGWGRPPVRSQFQKGVSGNPKGRSRYSIASLREQVEQIALAPVRVIEDGVHKMWTERQISATRLANMMVAGDLAAWKLFIRALKRGRKHASKYSGIEMVVRPKPMNRR